jgi:hypothetical protein
MSYRVCEDSRSMTTQILSILGRPIRAILPDSPPPPCCRRCDIWAPILETQINKSKV